MFHNTKVQILKQEVLTKRATGRSRTSPINYKERLFVLTPTHLTYYEGNLKARGKEKNSLEISKIKAVEKVDDYALKKKFCFLVQYEDYVLYIVAKDEKQRCDWITILREEIETKVNKLQQTFHPGVYIGSSWGCCKEKDKNARGCRKSYFYNVLSNGSTRTATFSKDNVVSAEAPLEDFKVTAKYEYKPTQENDLPLQKDQVYTIIDSTQTNWWFARNDLGQEGYIPSNYVVRHVGMESEKWYHRDMTRQEADLVLKDCNVDGTFLVRNSSQANMYTLSFCFQGVIKHYHIKLDKDNLYYVSIRHNFDTISQLVEYHRHNSAGLVTRLRVPYTGVNSPPVMLGSAVFQINRKELSLKKQIGTGQFGTVHEAMWRNKITVAVKMMKPGTMSEHDFIEEARVMWRFQHKNLVSIYGVCITQSPLCIIVEYMKNGSLLDYLRANKELLSKPQTLIDVVFQVTSAMKYLEEEKFIHRDLAARNCLVGEKYFVKVGDFGLSRYVLDDEYTASEGTKFPVKWASPEVIDYTKFSSKSDVWAFGVLCWEVFTVGKTPYPTFTNPQVADEVRRGYRLPQPRTCPVNIYAIIKKCWEKKPEERPSFRILHKEFEKLTENFTDP